MPLCETKYIIIIHLHNYAVSAGSAKKYVYRPTTNMIDCLLFGSIRLFQTVKFYNYALLLCKGFFDMTHCDGQVMCTRAYNSTTTNKFDITGPTKWNELALTLRDAPSLLLFRFNLKICCI